MRRLFALRAAVCAALFAAAHGYERRALRRQLDAIDKAISRQNSKPQQAATADRRARAGLLAGQEEA